MSAPVAKAIEVPPINEIGFAVVTDGTLVDPYDVRGLHDQFRSEYPRHSRQAPATLESAPLVGSGITIDPNDNGVPPRWWFLSRDESRLVQAQERFAGWSWRRNATLSTSVVYPGFDDAIDIAFTAFETILNWRDQNWGGIPAPTACQLLYDNFVPLLTPEGDHVKLSKILRILNTVEPAPVFGWHFEWNEHFGDGEGAGFSTVVIDGRPTLSVQLDLTGVITPDGRTVPVLRFMFLAARAVSDWNAVRPFFKEAHDYIHAVMLRITTDEIRKSWGLG